MFRCFRPLSRAAGAPSLLLLPVPQRELSLSPFLRKTFKHKPVPPKIKMLTKEDLFGDRREWPIPPGGYLLLIIPVSTLLLGVWQVFRWRWKLGLIDEMEQKVHAVPVEFPVTDLDALESMEYRKVKVRGKFEYGKEVLMGPRQLVHYAVDEQPSKGGGFWGPGATPTGYHVITPFHVEGHNLTILVNRGWISDKLVHKYRSTQDPVEIVGVVRLAEKRQPFMMKDTGAKAFLLFRDIPAMADKLGSAEAFLDLVSISGMDLSTARLMGLPVPGQTRVTLRNEHVSYFCTWFTLSGITAYMWYRRFLLRKPLM